MDKGVHVLFEDNAFRGLVHVDKSGDWLVYSASPDPTQLHLYRHGKGKTTKLTKETGLYSAAFSTDGSIYVLTARLKDAMPKTTVHKADDTLIGELPSVAEEPPFDPNVDLLKVGRDGWPPDRFSTPPSFGRASSMRKKNIRCWSTFTAARTISTSWPAKNRWLLDQWYADQGFIVVAIDGRRHAGPRSRMGAGHQVQVRLACRWTIRWPGCRRWARNIRRWT